jgi:hypothetical protein
MAFPSAASPAGLDRQFRFDPRADRPPGGMAAAQGRMAGGGAGPGVRRLAPLRGSARAGVDGGGARLNDLQ